MQNEKSVVVISNSHDNRRDMCTILSFIGEHTHAIDFDGWQETIKSLTPTQIGMILCSPADGQGIESFLHTAKELLGELPVVCFADACQISDECDARTRRMMIASFTKLPSYSELNDAIYRAQCFQDALAIRGEQRSKRPIHLFRSLVGTSREIQSVRMMMSQVADKDVTVLIEGESGTGKEVVARNLHYHSERRDGPFVPVNCGAIPAELLESELFGHEKGAFTGAVNARAGRFEMAEGGTLFLDEIGDMPLHMQVKILRVLQEKSYERVGGNKTFQTDVRIIAATHRNLEKMIEDGGFREDLYYRLNVFPIEMPSLRERSEDIPLLIHELVKRMESEGRGSIRFSSSAVLSLCKHSWPGNVRELANLTERMAIMRPSSVAGVQDLPGKYRYIEADDAALDTVEDELDDSPQLAILNVGDTMLLPEEGIDLKEYIASLEQNLIQQALDNSNGIVARAADQLMIRRTTLVEKMRKYGMQR